MEKRRKSNYTIFTAVLHGNYFISHLVALIVTLNDPEVMNWSIWKATAIDWLKSYHDMSCRGNEKTQEAWAG